ncbi:MAG: AAA family ATPase [Candidatus Thorarchaeota archaeon]
MTAQPSPIPKAIFQALELAFQAEVYDQRQQLSQAYTTYVQAAKVFFAVIQKFPQLTFHKMWNTKARLCINRAKQLRLVLQQGPEKDASLNPNNCRSYPSSFPSNSKEKVQQQDLEAIIRASQVKPDRSYSWDDIIGLEAVKAHLQEVVYLPLDRAEILEGSYPSPRSVLLFGPPGCGKTHLVRVLAAQVDIPVFNITASSLLSKWHGESEKMIRTLFQVAWEESPSIIFIDEFDGMFGGSVDSFGNSHSSEMAVKLQKELQRYMDGLETPSGMHTITIAATNFPWSIQPAQIRRFTRRLYVAPPSDRVILHMLTRFCKEVPNELSPSDLDSFVPKFHMFTPSEIHSVFEAARMRTYDLIKLSPTSYHKRFTPRLVTYYDLEKCASMVNPLLHLHGTMGVGTIDFRYWNDDFGYPSIYYPIQSWERLPWFYKSLKEDITENIDNRDPSSSSEKDVTE